MGHATGEARELPLRPTFDRRIKLEFHGARITSDGELLAYRELDDVLGLTEIAITKLLDGRRGKNVRHQLGGLFRQSVFGRLAGYEDVDDRRRARGRGSLMLLSRTLNDLDEARVLAGAASRQPSATAAELALTRARPPAVRLASRSMTWRVAATSDQAAADGGAATYGWRLCSIAQRTLMRRRASAIRAWW